MDAETGSELHIRLFGPMEIRREDRVLPLRSRKAAGLLALLLLRAGREVQREWLAETLWPDSDLPEALTSLRQRLADLRRALGEEAARLETPSTRSLRFDTGQAHIDVSVFDQEIARGDEEALRRAIALVTGPLLEGWNEPWILGEREARHAHFLKAIKTLATRALEAGDTAGAIERLQQGVRTEVWEQELHRMLMQTYARQSNYEAAFHVYTDLRDTLHRLHHADPEPETSRVYQELRARGRQRAAPIAPVAAQNVPPFHVPVPMSRLIGRDDELSEIQSSLLTSRLVTITGLGGCGKTRLALEAGHTLRGEYFDGIYFVDLSSLESADRLPQTIASALKIPAARNPAWREALHDFLRDRSLLLIVDNCEPVQDACLDLFHTLLRDCATLRILATSRQSFGIRGESALRLSPLPVPAENAVSSEALALLPSVRLFCEHAQAVRSDFRLTPANAPAVAAICRAADGLPLALELAAGLLTVLTPQELAETLPADRLGLQHRDVTTLSRHRTLTAMLDSSYRLLTPEEQKTFLRLSVFVGGFTREAAETVAAPAGDIRADRGSPAPITLLSGLVTKSLVVAEERDGRMRFRLLETVRQYAGAKLRAVGERKTCQARHQQVFAELAARLEPGLTGPEQEACLERLETELGNLRAALKFSYSMTTARTALNIAAALGRFWQIRGYFAEGRETLERLLHAAGEDAAPTERANAMNWAALLAIFQSDYESARRLCECALPLWEIAQDAKGLGGAYGVLGIAAKDTGQSAEARGYFEKSLEFSRQANDRVGEAGALGYLGIVAAGLSEQALARRYFEEALALRRQMQDLWGIAASLNNLGLLARQRGENHEAQELLEESLSIRQRLHDRRSLAVTLNALGEAAAASGDFERAETHYAESRRLALALGDRRSMAYSLEHYADLAFRREQWEQAARLYGAAAALREAIRAPRSPDSRETLDLAYRILRARLGDAHFETSFAAGRHLDYEEIV